MNMVNDVVVAGSTPQEEFWAGSFGNEYIERNRGADLLAAKTAIFARILARMENIGSVLELGANIGLNLRAIDRLVPGARLDAVEINPRAAAELRKWGRARVFEGSILDFEPRQRADLVFTSGVLIHLPQERLSGVYRLMYEAARRYVLMIEYYNPTPVEMCYRGHSERLFKRDFAGEMMDAHPDLRLLDYGFVYHRDPVFPADDVTWFILEKESCRG